MPVAVALPALLPGEAGRAAALVLGAAHSQVTASLGMSTLPLTLVICAYDGLIKLTVV